MTVYIAPPEKYNGLNGIENILIFEAGLGKGGRTVADVPCDPGDVGFAALSGRRSEWGQPARERSGHGDLDDIQGKR